MSPHVTSSTLKRASELVRPPEAGRPSVPPEVGGQARSGNRRGRARVNLKGGEVEDVRWTGQSAGK
ncbi:hypothetical protein P12x_001697 [Tundrisphaera lichenicola]|uniref:hypothetical protein n=1 Tax=Tundrisphaera lichenicola TaxID=2029860 RepID=UPI003EBB5EFA